jgi:hypothetical protein
MSVREDTIEPRLVAKIVERIIIYARAVTCEKVGPCIPHILPGGGESPVAE